jgi:hypothetical protein
MAAAPPYGSLPMQVAVVCLRVCLRSAHDDERQKYVVVRVRPVTRTPYQGSDVVAEASITCTS